MAPVFRWQSAVDFLVLSAALYLVLLWGKQARAMRLSLAIVGLRGGSLLAQHLGLPITGWVLDGASFIAVALLLIIFQPELRHAVMRVDSFLRRGSRPGVHSEATHRAVSDAAFALARAGLGALMVVVREDPVGELATGGITLGADVSPEILQAVFGKASPVHDGAAIISGNRIVRLSAVLPLTQRADLPRVFGTRHRAAIGLGERCDALLVVVSEERRVVTLIYDHEIVPVADAAALAWKLGELRARPVTGIAARARRLLFYNLGVKLAAIGLAALVWGLSALLTGTTVRTLSVPLEFTNVPGGMEISKQSATRVEIQLRGSAWRIESLNLPNLVARFNLRGLREGTHTLVVGAETVNLPPGVLLDRVSPRAISIELLHPAKSR